MVKKITRNNFRQEILESEQPTLLAVMVDSCVWCREQMPILSELTEEGVSVGMLDADAEKELTAELAAEGYPTILAYCHGSEYDRLEGFHSKAILKELAEDGMSD